MHGDIIFLWVLLLFGHWFFPYRQTYKLHFSVLVFHFVGSQTIWIAVGVEGQEVIIWWKTNCTMRTVRQCKSSKKFEGLSVRTLPEWFDLHFSSFPNHFTWALFIELLLTTSIICYESGYKYLSDGLPLFLRY